MIGPSRSPCWAEHSNISVRRCTSGETWQCAELVANSWDISGATRVEITVPTPSEYLPTSSAVSLVDDGLGMSEDEVENNYLVIGRNRRASGQPAPEGRRVMGRKGVGKLAGFGLGRTMKVTTVQAGVATSFHLDGASLKSDATAPKVLDVPGRIGPVPEGFPFGSGTQVTMESLKHKSPLDVDTLHRALARRFSRVVRGEMSIKINGEDLREPAINFETQRASRRHAGRELLTTAERSGGRRAFPRPCWRPNSKASRSSSMARRHKRPHSSSRSRPPRVGSTAPSI